MSPNVVVHAWNDIQRLVGCRTTAVDTKKESVSIDAHDDVIIRLTIADVHDAGPDTVTVRLEPTGKRKTSAASNEGGKSDILTGSS